MPAQPGVNEYLEKKASAEQLADCKELVKLCREITGKAPRMWGTSIVGFGSYHYVYPSGREGDAPLLGLAVRAKEIALYLAPDLDAKPLLARLGRHKMGAGCLYIRKLADVDRGVLERLARASVDELERRYPARKAG